MPDFSSEIAKMLAPINLDPAREAQIIEEVNQHLVDRYEELQAAGATADSAAGSVLAELRAGKFTPELSSVLRAAPGPVPLGKNESSGLFGEVWKDMQFGIRLLRSTPAFSTVALLSLALGIGANTALFQLLNAVRLQSLPVEKPNELAAVRIVTAKGGRTGRFAGRYPHLTSALWQLIREKQQAFSSLAAWGTQRVNLSQGGEAHYADALWVSGTFFSTLGVQPVRGRLLSEEDDQPGCGVGGVVISYSYWQREFGASNQILGHKLAVERQPFTVIGVTPASFFGVEVGRNFDVALPVCAQPLVNPEDDLVKNPSGWWLAAIGRLKPGWSLEQASAQLAAISPSIFEATVPPTYDAVDGKTYLRFQLGAKPAASGFSSLREEYQTPLWLLMAIAGLVLMIACANLANLLMARSSARQREMSVRMALGASRARLIRQLMAESFLLTAAGAILGAALAQVLSRLLVLFLSTHDKDLFVNLLPDWRVLLFTTALTVFTCVLFGLGPALQATQATPADALKANSRGVSAGRGRHMLRRALVVSQVALSVVLLVGALLFVRTLRNLQLLNAGFRRQDVLVTEIHFESLGLATQRRMPFQRELLSRLRAIPGVRSAAAVSIVPVSGNGWNENISIPDSAAAQRKLANFNQISSDYFKTMGTPFLAGRDFNDGDTGNSPPVAIVTESFAKQFLDGANPIGKTFSVVKGGGKPDQSFQIVGLVKDAKYTDLREDFSPIVFLNDAQEEQPSPDMQLVMRSEIPLGDVVASVKHDIAAVDPSIVLKFRIFETIIQEGLLRERLMATLSSFFGLLAAVLAMVGLYGLISYVVVRRRNEIGIRVALGANPRDIMTMILHESATLLVLGLATGTVLAMVTTRTARALLYGLGPDDPITLLTALSTLAVVAIAASLLPATRAARLDPMQALREE